MQNTEGIHKRLVNGKVVSKTQVATGHFQISVLCPHIARNTAPGQFIQVRVNGSLYDPLLSRPFAVYKAKGDVVDILFKVVGKGTSLLAEKCAGDTVDILGPLGNGFPIDDGFQRAMLIAGGMGIAALMSLAEAVKGREIAALIGASTQSKIVGRDDLLALGAEVHVATEDGTAGQKGMVSELMEDVILTKKCPIAGCRIFACGPNPMLKAISRLATRYEMPIYVSLEERMACGVGACLGCVCEVASSGDDNQYKTVCVDGPVFNAQEIVWK
ncbi:dihydroorotate dehydrogenase electron transfer subunit [Candidatus Poribacteria bacterium]